MRLFGQGHYEILCEPRVLRRLTTLFMHPAAHLAPACLPPAPTPATVPLFGKAQSAAHCRRSFSDPPLLPCVAIHFFSRSPPFLKGDVDDLNTKCYRNRGALLSQKMRIMVFLTLDEIPWEPCASRPDSKNIRPMYRERKYSKQRQIDIESRARRRDLL